MRCIDYVGSKRIAVAALAFALIACSSPASSTVIASSTAPSVQATRLSEQDTACGKNTFGRLVAAVNSADEQGLRELLRGASLTIDRVNYGGEDAAPAMLRRAQAGERWNLICIDLNGRGSHGGIDFGVVLRRVAPDLPSGSVEGSGKGVILCPEQVFAIIGVGP